MDEGWTYAMAYGSHVDIRVLGPVSVLVEGRPLVLGGRKQRTVLALVIAGAGRPVLADALISGVYGGDASDGARRTIHTYVSNLRRELGDVIIPSGQGYTFGVDPSTIDAVRFETLYRNGGALVETSPEQAAVLLRDALGLWQGHAYADVEAHTVLEAEKTRLEELRLAALEARVSADLALGLHRDLIGELEALIGEYPLQEGFREHQMVALYRSGRQSEALRAFTRTREFLGGELGIDPSPELQELEQLILVQDPGLNLQARTAIERRAILAAELDEGLRFAPVGELDAALARRNQTLEARAAAAGGSVLDVRGTAVYAEFPSVADAIEAATALVDTTVQVAIDYGDVEKGNDSAAGPPVTRALRLAAVGHPGQVLVAEDAHAKLASEGTGRWSVAALGLQTIRGLDRPVQVFQLVGEGMIGEFPALRLDRLPPPLPGGAPGSVAGYELRGELGGGVTGVVHRAYQPTVGREVALRVIRPELVSDPRFVRRFEAEAQRIAAIDHPHLVPLLDYWREPDGAFLVHRLMGGSTVRTEMNTGPMAPSGVVALLDQIGAAAAAGHARGVSHGRIRPENVFLDDSGYAYLAGLGLAAMFDGMVSAPADAYTAPEAIGGPPSEIGDIYSLGVLAVELLAGHEAPHDRGLPTLGSPADAVVTRATHPQPGERQRSVRQFLDELTAALGTIDTAPDVERRSDVRNPYKGLGAFQEADAIDFHGRSDLIDTLVAAVETRPFTLVAGPSGIGKSSVVRAGLIPRVRAGVLGETSDWLVTDMFPGARPFDELETAVARVAVHATGHNIEAVRSGTRSIADTAAELLPDSTRLLLVIDQFEELFTHNSDEQIRRRFLEALTEVANDRASPVHVVATMRADFLDKPLGYSEFGRLLTSSTVMVPALGKSDLAEVVRLPAASVGVVMDEALVEALSTDADAEPGALPLLQHSLTELFNGRPTDRLTLDEYRTTGGLAGAIRRRAETIYSSLDPTDRSTAREVFIRLVNVSPDTEDTRRRVKRSELDHLPVQPDSTDRVIEAFGRHRLLVFDRDPTTRGPTVEVAHEALFTQWDRLAGWIDHARQDLLTARRIDAAAMEWDGSGRDTGYLFTGPRLEQASTWRTGSGLEPSPVVAEFIDASIEREARETAERHKRRRTVLRGFAAAAVVALVLAAFAWVQRGAAQRETQLAEARGLVLEAENNIAADPELSILLALEAIDTFRSIGDAPASAAAALRDAITNQRIRARLPGGSFVSVNHDGSRLASEGEAGGIAIWDIREIAAPKHIVTMTGTDEGLVAVEGQFLRSANELIVVLEDPETGERQLRLFDMTTGRFAATLPFDGLTHGLVEVSPQGDLLALVTQPEDPSGARIEVLDRRTNTVLWANDEPVFVAAFSGDSRIAHLSVHPLLTNFRLTIADAQSGREIRTIPNLPIEDAWSTRLEFSPDNTRLAYTDARVAGVIDVESGREVFRADGLAAFDLRWLPDGDRLVIRTTSVLNVIDAASGTIIRELPGNKGATADFSVVPGASLVASAGASDDATLLIDVDRGDRDEVKQFSSPLSGPASAHLSPNGEAIFITGSHEFTVIDTTTGDVLWEPQQYGGTLLGILAVSSPNGAFVAEPLGMWSTVELHDTADELGIDRRQKAKVYTAPRFWLIRGVSSDGSLAVISRDHVSTMIVRTEDGSEIAALDAGSILVEAFFSPNGAFLITNNNTTAFDNSIGEAPSLRIWEVESGALLNDMDGFEGYGVEFTTDGEQLVLGQLDGTITAFDFLALREGLPPEQAIRLEIPAHNNLINTLRISPDDSMVASGSFGERAKLWDLETGRALGEFGTTAQTAVAFDPVRPWLWVSEFGHVWVDTLDLDELIPIARDRLTRDMTDDECVLYLRRPCDG